VLDIARCRVAFVGAGSTIREHVRAFQDVAGVDLVGIANRTRAKAEQLAQELSIPAVFDTIDDLAACTRADVVVVAVYESAIRETMEACLAHPWGVLMEKPIGLDLHEARQITAAAKAAGRRVWVGLNRRALGSTRAVLDDLAANPGPRFIHVQDQQNLATARALGHKPEVVNNWMFANSIHLVDYLRVFGRGEVTKVDVLSAFDADEPGLVLAKINFESGDIGLYEALWHAPGPWACTVTTERRRWELRPLEKTAFQNPGERNLNQIATASADAAFKPGFRSQAEHVVAAWRGAASDAPTIADALATTELVAQIYGRAACHVA
jgi:predicted dehydrogenase